MSIQMRGAEVAKAMKEWAIEADQRKRRVECGGSKSMPYDHSGRSERK